MHSSQYNIHLTTFPTATTSLYATTVAKWGSKIAIQKKKYQVWIKRPSWERHSGAYILEPHRSARAWSAGKTCTFIIHTHRHNYKCACTREVIIFSLLTLQSEVFTFSWDAGQFYYIFFLHSIVRTRKR